MDDADHLDRGTGAEGEHIRGIAQGADIHSAGVQRFAQGRGRGEFRPFDLVGHVLAFARGFQQRLDRGFLVGHAQRLQVASLDGGKQAEGEGSAQQQAFEWNGVQHGQNSRR